MHMLKTRHIHWLNRVSTMKRDWLNSVSTIYAYGYEDVNNPSFESTMSFFFVSDNNILILS